MRLWLFSGAVWSLGMHWNMFGSTLELFVEDGSGINKFIFRGDREENRPVFSQKPVGFQCVCI